MRWSDLRGNPVLRSEGLRLARRWPETLVLVLIVWIPLAWLIRRVLPNAAGVGSLWQEFLLSTMLYAFRPDVLVALFLTARSCAARQWHAMRTELALTRLTPVEIVAGKAALPVVLLVTLNTLAAPASYGGMIVDTSTFTRLPGLEILVSGGGLVAPFALLEDVLFTTVLVLVGLREYLFTRDAMLATMRAVGWIVLLGLVVNLASWAGELAYALMPPGWVLHLILRPGRDYVFHNACFFALVLPIEWMLARFLHGRIRRRMHEWIEPAA